MFKKYTLGIYTGFLGIFIPSFVFAEDNFAVKIVGLAEAVVSALFPIVVTLAVIAFAYNIARYLSSKDIADQSIFKAGIINSFIGLFVIFTVFGTVKVLAQAFGIPSLGESLTVSDVSGLGGTGTKNFRDYAFLLARFFSQRIVPLMISSAVLMFFGNIAISMTKTDSEEERTNLNSYLRWGTLAIFILLALFSIISIFTGTLFGTEAFIPQFPTS
jgi:hypothetical protein